MIGIDDMHQRNLCTWLVSTFISFCCACGVARSVGAQDNLTNVPDPDPAVQLAALRVADGYEVSLFASDPMIDPPIAMAWDERGRLWVATSTSYPQPVPGQAGRAPPRPSPTLDCPC